MMQRISSEGELIGTYLAPLAVGLDGALDLVDDTACLGLPDGCDLVVTTDAIAEGIHFFADDAPEDIGWKALAVNVSDLAAKGARPLAYQLALSFPEPPRHDVMARLAKGLGDAQEAFAIVLSGGDTDQRPGPITLTVTALGTVPRGQFVRRSAARAGDIICVTGTLGDAALGLKLRRADPDCAAWGLSAADNAHLLGRYLRPQPRLIVAPLLRDAASAAMDVSDGLIKDLGRLGAASGIGLRVDLEHLPLSAAARKAINFDAALLEHAASGGDDYEIVFTAPASAAGAIRSWAQATGLPVTVIGACTEEGGVVVMHRGHKQSVSRTGWDHF